jgi:hypothetical protein
MTSIAHATILARTGQCLAAAVFTIGLAFGAAPLATADDEWDLEAYDACMNKTLRDPDICCLESGGILTGTEQGGCGAPPAVQNNWPTNPTAKPGTAPPPLAPTNGVGPTGPTGKPGVTPVTTTPRTVG